MNLFLQSEKNLPAAEMAVIFVAQKAKNEPLLFLPETLKNYKQQITNIIKNKFSGTKNDSWLLRPLPSEFPFASCLLVGLGERSDSTSESIRRCGSTIYGILKSQKVNDAVIFLESIGNKKEDNSCIAAITQGLLLAAGELDFLKTKDKKEKPTHPQSVYLATKLASAKLTTELEQNKTICESVLWARRLGDTPGNLMTPALLAREVTKAAKDIAHLHVDVWNEVRIRKEKNGGLS